MLLAPITIPEDRDVQKSLQLFSKQGYARIKYDGAVVRIDQAPKEIGRKFDLVVDRIVVKDDEDFRNRLANAVDNAFFEGKGRCVVEPYCSRSRTC